jgi:hypothetical protein
MAKRPTQPEKPDSPNTGDQPAEPRETEIPETGEYSLRMKADEYKDWVRQTVSAQIWGRMVAILSAIGIAAFLGLFTVGSNYIVAQIDTKLTAETKTIKTDLKSDFQRDVERVEKNLLAAIPTAVTKELENQIRTNNLTQEITKKAVAEVTKNEGVEAAIRNLIIARSEEILKNPNPAQSSLRAVALQQILLFGEDEQKIKAIDVVIREERTGGDLEFALALQNYLSFQPKKSPINRESCVASWTALHGATSTSAMTIGGSSNK